jgi:hypothetical protein
MQRHPIALPPQAVLCSAQSRGAKMSFTIGASNSAGAISFSCATASDAVDKVLELEQQQFKNITVKDGTGRTIDLDELSALCEASED